MPGMLTVAIAGTRGDWVSPPPAMSAKTSVDRYFVTPRPRMFSATPDTTWSTPKVTVATACSSPPSTPPTAPASTPAQALPVTIAPQAPNQVPRIMMPSRPMLTTPARSDHRPPRPASPIGTAAIRAAPIAPPEVMSLAPVSTRATESRNSRPSRPRSRICQVSLNFRAGGAAARAAAFVVVVTPPLLPSAWWARRRPVPG